MAGRHITQSSAPVCIHVHDPTAYFLRSISVSHFSEERWKNSEEEELKKLSIQLDVCTWPCALHLLVAPCHLGLSVARPVKCTGLHRIQ